MDDLNDLNNKNTTLEKILFVVTMVGFTALMGWSFYDTLKAEVDIKREAKRRNVSVYQVCDERNRTDVYELLELEEGFQDIYYVLPEMPIKIPDSRRYTKNKKKE